MSNIKFNGKPVNELTKAEWNDFAKYVSDEQVRLNEEKEALKVSKNKLSEEQKKMEAAQQLSSLAGAGASVGAITNTIVKGTYGSLCEFSLQDEWTEWYERFEQYVAVNEVPADKTVSLFLTMLGKEGYSLLRNLCMPTVPSTLPLVTLVKYLEDHLNPVPCVIAERFKFKDCKQQADEDIKQFLARLKRMSMHCQFEQNLETNIRDQFVWGLAEENIKKRLLGEPNLTYSRAVELALSLEAARKDAAQMNANSKSEINFVAEKGNATKKKGNRQEQVKCFCCGKDGHKSNVCRFKKLACNVCGKTGHLKSVCKVNKSGSTKKNSVSSRQNFVEEVEHIADDLNRLFNIQPLRNVKSEKPLVITLSVESESMPFEIDTGSPISAISYEKYLQSDKLKMLKPRSTTRHFKAYAGDKIVPLGIIDVSVEFKNNKYILELFVMPGSSMPIIGREWMVKLKMLEIDKEKNLLTIGSIKQDMQKDAVMSEFKNVFVDSLGCYSKRKVSLQLKEGATPVFMKPRPVPYAMRDRIEKEIDRLVAAEILEPVQSSQWATPVVPVLKADGSIRLCGDFKVTVNPCLAVDRNPIPRLTDLSTKLAGGKIFSKLDMTQAYHQLLVDDKSKQLLTLSTHKGLFACNRLMYGVASAPGIFQREIEELLQDIKGVVSYFDDIFITGETQAEHDERLREVLRRLQKCNITLKKDKCEFSKKRIKFLGFELDADGIRVSELKTLAISKMKKPENVLELKSFLGMVSHYSKFIKNYANIVAPLYELLRKEVEWIWTQEREKAFGEAKEAIISPEVLTHYSTQIPVKITCDASPRGLGAVLSHVFKNGSEKPIAFVSKILTKAQKNYSQLDREALALVFGVKSFHQFVYGRKFTLETDHQPLTFIFGSKKGLPQMAASRVQRWAVFLSGYDFDIKYIKGTDNGPADGLSRVIVDDLKAEKEVDIDDYSYLNYVNDISSINSEVIRNETASDPILNQVREFLLEGWPSKIDDKFLAFKNRQLELTVEDGCVLWGHRVVVPFNLRKEMLDQLHSSHWGVVKMKALARSYLWWPNIDSDIERLAKSCLLCARNASNPRRSELHVFNWPSGPNERVHVDFCGPIEGFMYLVITDAYSKWIDIVEMSNITASSTIKILRSYFATWGIPIMLVSDNGPTFTSEEFKIFLSKNNVKHLRSAPYHPPSNGAAENAVKSFKSKFKLLIQGKMSRQEALVKYLMFYRSTPHCTTGVTPAELQIGRKMRTRLDAIKPSVQERVEQNQENQKRYFKNDRKESFKENDIVMTKNYSNNQWEPAVVNDKLGPVTYSVQTESNKNVKRHLDQIRPVILSKEEEVSVVSAENKNIVKAPLTSSEVNDVCVPCVFEQGDKNIVGPARNTLLVPETASSVTKVTHQAAALRSPPMLRRSTRIRKATSKLNL